MELSTKLHDAINKHINAEFYSAYLYLSMSAYCDSMNLPGFARWLRVQHGEELSHALKLFDFLNDRGGRIELQAIGQPPIEFESPLAVMEQTLEHERAVTSEIHRLYELAVEESDYPAQVLLQWFVTEQVEEEKTAGEIVEHLKLVGAQGAGLLMIDTRLGERGGEGG
jgi:ferritin